MANPDRIGMLHYVVAIGAVWPVEVVNVNDPVPVHDMVVPVVNDDPRAEDVPGALHPGAPPVRIIRPAVRRNVYVVIPAQNVLHRFPIVHVDEIAVIGMVSLSAVGIPFYRFHDDFLAIEVFIPYDLQYGLVSAYDLDLDNGYVLGVKPAEQRLQYDSMETPLPPVFDADVVDPAVIVQVEVVDPVLFRVELSFKIP